MNKYGCESLGAELEEMIGSNISDFILKEDQVLFTAALQNTINGGKHEECEFRIYNKENDLCWMHAIFTSRYNIIGQIIGILVQSTDITERKHTELCLRASERKYRELAESGEPLIRKLDGD